MEFDFSSDEKHVIMKRKDIINYLDRIEALLRLEMTRVSKTAQELRAGTIHPAHAANRLDDIVKHVCMERVN